MGVAVRWGMAEASLGKKEAGGRLSESDGDDEDRGQRERVGRRKLFEVSKWV